MASTQFAPRISNAKGAKRQSHKVEVLFRKMRKISSSCIKKQKPRRITDYHEPISMGQRVVLRSQGRVPVKMLMAIHKMYKNNSVRATDFVRGPTYGSMSTELRCAVREYFEG